MKNELEELLTQPDPLSFTEAKIQWLLDHIGDPDGAIRDDLAYTLLARGFMAGGFTTGQKQLIARQTTAGEALFTGQGSESDLIFTRSFTALLGALILSADAESVFLTGGATPDLVCAGAEVSAQRNRPPRRRRSAQSCLPPPRLLPMMKRNV